MLIVVDLGGTQIRTATFDLAGAMLSRRSVPTPKLGGPAAVIATVIAQIRQSATGAGQRVKMVGVSALGPVDPRPG